MEWRVLGVEKSDVLAGVAGYGRLLSADSVEKVFLRRRTKFLRTAGAFRARRPEGPHRFTQKRHPTFPSALEGVAALEATTNAFSRDF
jgi:hypothetical protein